jgi:hypothetical protein
MSITWLYFLATIVTGEGTCPHGGVHLGGHRDGALVGRGHHRVVEAKLGLVSMTVKI